MSSKFRFDDKSLQQQILHACAELKNTDVCTEPHTFSDRMRARMSDTLLKERRYRLWQKTKMLLAVLLTLLVAAGMFWGLRNMDEIKAAVEEFWNTESEPPFGRAPRIVISDELKQDYVVLMNLVRTYSGYDNDYDGSVVLRNIKSGQQISIAFTPTRLTETYSPTKDVMVWGRPAELSGSNIKTLRWVWPFENNGVYFTVRSTVTEKELFRVAEGISIR
jgi:hypothetical protein